MRHFSQFFVNKEDLIEFIAGEIDKEWPVEIAFRYRKGGGHAVLAVGYERKKDLVSSLYCLDPASEAPSDSSYNVEIKMSRNGKRIQHHMGMACDILIDEALSIEK